MATKTYKWKADTTYQSDTSLSYGVTPSTHTGWQTEQAGSQSGSWTYWYRDANVAGPGGYTDANSSRVALSLTESWVASIDDLNNLSITITTTINSVVRDDLQGSNQDTPGRNINIYREQGGSAILSLTDTQLASAHTLYTGPLPLSQYTFTLSPGQSAQRSSLYLHNQTIGYQSYDDIWFGVLFLNDLPMPTTYSLVYDANGGTGAPATQTATTGEESYTFTVSSTEPTWGYYRFLGWSTTRHQESCTDADVEYRGGDTITLANSSPSLTLYAVWMKDYRPGATLDTGTSIWKSHDRTNGACHILPNTTGTNWHECRTIGGEVGAQGNPPLILHAANANSWYNQKRIGKP